MNESTEEPESGWNKPSRAQIIALLRRAGADARARRKARELMASGEQFFSGSDPFDDSVIPRLTADQMIAYYRGHIDLADIPVVETRPHGLMRTPRGWRAAIAADRQSQRSGAEVRPPSSRDPRPDDGIDLDPSTARA